PTTSPCFELGRTAWTALFGTAAGGIAVSPIAATPPAETGFFRTSPPEVVPWSAGDDGQASERTPAGWMTPEADLPSALIAPSPGSCWYMIRHVTPVAKAEIAIGRKTIVLNPTDQRTRSVRTAKISPTAVTKAGTTATQIALFLIAVLSVDVV